uniref:Uncharacterized protein n=1 Tax=Anguilla anguilla TaxID=7936 RepID=A0A0E9SI97_ANGAN
MQALSAEMAIAGRSFMVATRIASVDKVSFTGQQQD